MPYACKLSVGGFVLPFFFVFNPGILMQGGVLRILSDTVVAIVLVVTSALALHGFVRQRSIPLPFRMVFALMALAMAIPQPAIQYAAATTAVGLYLVLRRAEQAARALQRKRDAM